MDIPKHGPTLSPYSAESTPATSVNTHFFYPRHPIPAQFPVHVQSSVQENLERIFDQENYQNGYSAMQAMLV